MSLKLLSFIVIKLIVTLLYVIITTILTVF